MKIYCVGPIVTSNTSIECDCIPRLRKNQLVWEKERQECKTENLDNGNIAIYSCFPAKLASFFKSGRAKDSYIKLFNII